MKRNSLKVLHAIPTFLPVLGGSEINVYYLAKKSQKLGVDPVILTFNMLKRWNPLDKLVDEQYDQLRVIRCAGIRPYPNYKYVRAILPNLLGIHVIPTTKLAKFFKESDIIHFHDEVDIAFGLWALNVKKPKIYHMRTLTFLMDSFKKHRTRSWLLRKCADFFICNSSATADCLMSLGVSKEVIIVIPNGVDISKFYPDSTSKADSSQILFVGRMQKEKGLHILLQAMTLIKIPLKLNIAVGTITDKTYYGDQIKKAQEVSRKYGHKITWYYKLDHSALIPLYRNATLLVSPSLKEPFGNVNIEAMACGTPVIGSRSGGIVDIVDDDVNGKLFTEGDAHELADILKNLMDYPSIINKYSKNAFKTIHSKFSWEKVTEQVTSVYSLLQQ